MARIAGVGSLLGFLFGNLDLNQSFPFRYFEIFNSESSMESQLKCLSSTVVLILISTQSIVCYVARESPLPKKASRTSNSSRNFLLNAFRSITNTFVELRNTLRTLHLSIFTLLKIQFFAWIGWFPVLFYSSSWVSEIYRAAQSSTTSETSSTLELDSTRAGSRAMFFHSLVSFVASIILPILITDHSNSSTDSTQRRINHHNSSTCFKTFFDLPILWASSHFLFAVAMALTYFTFNSNPPSMTLAFLVTSLTGLSWALTHWAPFALIGVLIESTSKSNASSLELTPQSRQDQVEEVEGLLSNQDGDEEEAMESSERNQTPKVDKAGTILGLHNGEKL